MKKKFNLISGFETSILLVAQLCSCICDTEKNYFRFFCCHSYTHDRTKQIINKSIIFLDFSNAIIIFFKYYYFINTRILHGESTVMHT